MSNYKVINHEWYNNGGGNMIAAIEIYHVDENFTMYGYADEDGVMLVTCDYIRNDIEFEQRMQIAYIYTCNVDEHCMYLDVVQECLAIYAQYVHEKQGRYAAYYLDAMTDEVRRSVSDAYIEWHFEHVGERFETNGKQIIMDDRYNPNAAEINEIEHYLRYLEAEFDKWSHSTAVSTTFENTTINISFGGKTAILSNNADSFSLLQAMLKSYLDTLK